ncbi:hypothetical protein DB346_05445 [Verrucomicrobia bacterium LW23]|nr:hypothetical protein DB346_05445 [Verrucomicrobia bacterium LW23]
MPRYEYPADFYADDKDISDLFAASGFTSKRLLNLALERGIVLSSELSKESLIDFLSLLPLSWRELQGLLKAIESPDKGEKLTTCKFDTSVDLDEVEKAVFDVRDLRGTLDNEAYIINRKDGGIYIQVIYSEVDPTSTRTIQRLHKEMEILINKSAKGFEVRYPQNSRGEAIVDKIFSTIPVPEGQEKPRQTRIELSGVIHPEKRTEFFIIIIDSLKGFKRRDVLDLKLNRISSDNTDSEDEDEKQEAEDKMRNAVKRMALSGGALLSTPQFKQISDDGFAIYRIVWEAREIDGNGNIYELEALFKDPENGIGFAYHIRGIREFDGDKYTGLKKQISLDQKNRLHDLIVEAAYSALDVIHKSITLPKIEGPL